MPDWLPPFPAASLAILLLNLALLGQRRRGAPEPLGPAAPARIHAWDGRPPAELSRSRRPR